MTGSNIGPYTITREIGRGGMGVVYLARDTKLDRDVAIKALPEELAQDADRLARFEREAKTLAQLNHPNIATVHGLEVVEGRHYLVMEYIEGDALQDRLASGPLKVDAALDIALQIAGALETAHATGVIHRDLKPANIKFTRSADGEGTAKVLDFGLAKPTSTSSGTETELANSPTEIGSPTMPGVILGTAGYMSPEQARGRPVDARSDIFSFGCVLYEMLTGEQVFVGETVTDSIGAALHKEPQWHTLPADTPRQVSYLLRQCLEKERRDRLHDIADARIVLQHAATGELAEGDESVAGRTPIFARPAVLMVGAILLLLLGYAASRVILPSGQPVATTPASPVVRSTIPFPEGAQLAGWGTPVIAISPNGRQIAYVAQFDGVSRLFIRHLDDDETILVRGGEPVEGPFFSPDGQWIGYAEGDMSGASAAQAQLKKVSLDGNSIQTLCPINDYLGATWSKDGTIYWVNTTGGEMRRVAENGGSSELVPLEFSGILLWPHLLPGDRHLLIHVIGQGHVPGLHLLDLETLEFNRLNLDAIDAAFVPTGHLVYVAPDRTLRAVAFNLDVLEIQGGDAEILGDLALSTPPAGAFAVSANGTLVYTTGSIRGGAIDDFDVVHVSRDGDIQRVLLESPEGIAFKMSPDGDRIVAQKIYGGLTVYDVDRGTRLELPAGDVYLGAPGVPLWSRDGDNIIFTAGGSEGGIGLYVQRSDGGAPPRTLIDKEGEEYGSSWVGEKILAGTADGLVLVDPKSGETESIDSNVRRGSWQVSPNGEWAAYNSLESGRQEVYVQRFPPDGVRYPVSSGGGSSPMWSIDGSELYYLTGDSMMAVEVTTDPEFRLGAAQELFENEDMRRYQVAPDGDGFILTLRKPESGIKTELNLVLNWFGELNALVPSNRSP